MNMPHDTTDAAACTRAGARRQAGFTLVESLVAMVVISVGMLGIAAMYVEGLRAGRTSVYRSTAVELVSDMADRIRANAEGEAAYSGAAGDNNCVGGGADCTPAELAADDLFWWLQSVQGQLPQGAAAVVFAPGANTDQYTISVTWAEPGVDGPLSYTMVMEQ
jgi:type IV pilus assembly protein PilV